MSKIKLRSKLTKLLRGGLLLFFCLSSLFGYAAENSKPFIVSLSPAVSSPYTHQPLTFTTKFSDPDGWQDIKEVYILITPVTLNKNTSNFLDAIKNAFWASYRKNFNALYLFDKVHVKWLGGFPPGSTDPQRRYLENSSVRLDCLNTSVSHSDKEKTLTIQWSVTFKSNFVGTKNIYFYVIDDKGADSDWIRRGAVIIRLNRPPMITRITPPDGSVFLAGSRIEIRINAIDLDRDPLQYQFTIGDQIKQPWSSTNSYSWLTSRTDPALVKITCEVRDVKGALTVKILTYNINKPNQPPVINSLTPLDNSTLLAGARIVVLVSASDPDKDPLEYQFSVGGYVIQPWSSTNTYSWLTYTYWTTETPLKITCEVRDGLGGQTLKEVTYNLINPSEEEVLQRVKANSAELKDFTAEMTLSSTLDGQPLGSPQFCRYYFKAPERGVIDRTTGTRISEDKPLREKTETFTDSSRATKTEALIISGYILYLIDPINRSTQEANLLEDSQIKSSTLANLNIDYDVSNFLASHRVTINQFKTDYNNSILCLWAIPQRENNLYTRIELYIDYNKRLLVKIAQYRNDELPQIMEVLETKEVANGVWLATKFKKLPNLSAGELVVTTSYSNIQANMGLSDSEFDPTKQY